MKKKLLFLFVSFFLAFTGNAQERISVQPQSEEKGIPVTNIPKCFCCDPIAFNLPSPPQIISANPPPLCACDAIKFSTPPCPGATFYWTVTDNFGNVIALSGGSTNAITLNYSLAQQVATLATSLTIKLKVCCGKNCVNNTLQVALKPIPKTNISFSLTDNGNGTYTATATAFPGAIANGWTLKEKTCPGPSPCDWVAGPIKWQSGGTTINVPNGVLVQGKCYVLTHYVNVCSPVYIAGPCTVYGVTCFTLDTKSLKKPENANDRNDAKACTPEMLQELQQIK
ncbi:MAG: hypothetical protein NTY07_04275 [Bacteroidia bacterium]|nr:hypothetical protein [Bacteroidia bacterium]